MANLLQSGVASAERVFDLLDAPEQPPDPEHPKKPLAAARPGRVRARHVPLPAGRAADRGPLARRRARAHDRDRRPDRRREDHAGQPDHALLRTRRRPHHPRRRRHHRDAARRAARRRSGWCCRTPGCSAARSGTTSPTAVRARRDDQILAAAQAAFVDRFVQALPDGYETVLEEETSNVSAGQRQLITIARAFLADPALLILDEATSSVDTRTELLVQHATAALRTNRTSFVVAHRLSTIRDADLILVMDHGRIVEQGTHPNCSTRAARTSRCTTRSSPRRGRPSGEAGQRAPRGDSGRAVRASRRLPGDRRAGRRELRHPLQRRGLKDARLDVDSTACWSRRTATRHRRRELRDAVRR